jgi:hypothetical protein
MLFWLVLACGGDPTPSPEIGEATDGLTIAYTHNVSGEIEPCG